MFSELYLLPLAVKLSLLGLFSLVIGSFLNVVIHRLPIMLDNQWTGDDKPASTFNLWFPRSFCTHCKQTIRPQHTIPLLSYLFLRGRCHHCQVSIASRYVITEAIFTVLSLFAAYWFGFNLTLVFSISFIGILVCLFWIDLQHQLLPDNLTLGLLWLGLIANTQTLFVPLLDAVLAAVGAYLFLWLFMQSYYLMTKKIGMGHGDFKLFAALGAWFGWTALPSILIISSLIGSVCGFIYLRLTKQSRQTKIPFGPCLVIAGLLALFGIKISFDV